MTTILILEDEKPAAERLIKGIRRFDASAAIAGPLSSVKEATAWFASHPSPDLVVADIQLADGISFEAFQTISPACPVIFATAYDEYLLEAFQYNGIDYLLKPLKEEQLERALTKYLRLREHFTGNLRQFLEGRGKELTRKERFVVKKGIGFVSIKTEEIRYFFTEQKIVFLVDAAGGRYVVDKTLSVLEQELDPRTFFRLNRKFLVHIDAIRTFKPLDKGRILVELNPPTLEPAIVSQETGTAFRTWMGK